MASGRWLDSDDAENEDVWGDGARVEVQYGRRRDGGAADWRRALGRVEEEKGGGEAGGRRREREIGDGWRGGTLDAFLQRPKRARTWMHGEEAQRSGVGRVGMRGVEEKEGDGAADVGSDISDPSMRPGVNPFASLGFASVEEAGAWWTTERRTALPTGAAAEDGAARARGGVQMRLALGRHGAEAVAGACVRCGAWECEPGRCVFFGARAPLVARRFVEGVDGRTLVGGLRMGGGAAGRVVEVAGGLREVAAKALARAVLEMGPGIPLPRGLRRAVRSSLPPSEEWNEVLEERGTGGGGEEKVLVCLVQQAAPGDGEVVAAVVSAERVRKAFAVREEQGECGGVAVVERNAVVAEDGMWGVGVMWTEPAWRRRGAVRSVLRALAEADGGARRRRLAFSHPTPAGQAVARALCAADGGGEWLVYEDEE
jgi:ESCO1/2 acetyl-transferase